MVAAILRPVEGIVSTKGAFCQQALYRRRRNVVNRDLNTIAIFSVQLDSSEGLWCSFGTQCSLLYPMALLPPPSLFFRFVVLVTVHLCDPL